MSDDLFDDEPYPDEIITGMVASGELDDDRGAIPWAAGTGGANE